MMAPEISEPTYRYFYDQGRAANYSNEHVVTQAAQHGRYRELSAFIRHYHLQHARCLEIGSGIGLFQDMVEDYWGTDVAYALARCYHKPYRVAECERYPFDDAMFDAIWTITAFEHIPGLQAALLELVRLLKPGGVLLFAPAWQCRSWAANGYAVRPYSDFNWQGKLVKSSIWLRNHLLWRCACVFPKRALRQAQYSLGCSNRQIRYRQLRANYATYWTSDSDACNSIDPHDAILWFLAHGFACLSHPNPLAAFFVRTGSLVFQKVR
jgi:SAM-dependent methyltransferase